MLTWLRRFKVPVSFLLVLCVLLVGYVGTASALTATNVVDTGDAGNYASVELDANGYPVVSYYDDTNRDLKLAHCNDAYCAGNDESIQTVDSTDNVGYDISLSLDASGFPVISYYDWTNGVLKLAHCNDANCAGNNESLQIVDSAGDVGGYTS